MTDPQDLEALLRQRISPLPPTEGVWETVSRRARRRKLAKALITGAAAVAVVAGVVPLVSTLRHTPPKEPESLKVSPSSRYERTPGSSIHPASVPHTRKVAPGLQGFTPTSLSFVKSTEGFLLGSLPRSPKAVLARTTDDGAHWSRLTTPDINISGTSVRFATPLAGFIFGRKYFVTGDGGTTWLHLHSPGYIKDLETWNLRIFALVSKCAHCSATQLYEGTVIDPTLRRVRNLPTLTGDSSSISLSGRRVWVMTSSTSGHGQVWISPDEGDHWHASRNPCIDATGEVTAWSHKGVDFECNAPRTKHAQLKRIYVHELGVSFWQLPHPPLAGVATSMSANSLGAVVIAQKPTTRLGAGGGFDVTTDNGRKWRITGPYMPHGARFVGFISQHHVVGIPQDGHFFAYSTDAGRDWEVTTFG